MRLSGLNNIAKETDDWSTTSSSMLTSSSEKSDESDWSGDLEKVKIELSTEEMSTSSKGTAGWLPNRHILKSKRKHAEAKGMSAGDKETAKGKPKRKHAARSESTLERTSVSVDGKDSLKTKPKRKDSSNRSLSSISKAHYKAEDHQYTARKTRRLSAFLKRGAARFSRPIRNTHFDVVPLDARSLFCEVVDDIVDSMYFLQCIADGVKGESLKCFPQQNEKEGGGIKEESSKWLSWLTGNKDNTNISINEASAMKSDAYYSVKGESLECFPQQNEGGGIKEESSKWLSWLTGNEDNTNISINEASAMKSDAYYLNRSATAASF